MFEFTPSMPVGDLVAAEEKMIWNVFRRDYITHRGSQVASQLLTQASLQLPTNSVLHSISNFLTPGAPSIDLPVHDPLIRNEKFAIWVNTILDLPSKDDGLFGVSDSYIFNRSRYSKPLVDFFQSHRSLHRVTTNLPTLLHNANVLLVYNYNAINQIRVNGVGPELRHFDALFRTILSNISADDGRIHHIEIPLSEHIYSYAQLQRAFKKFDRATAPVVDDPSFFFLIHLIGYLAEAQTSYFTQLPQGVIERLNLVLTCHDNAIIYNLGDLKVLAEKASGFARRILSHVGLLKLSQSEQIVADLAAMGPDALDAVVEKAARSDDGIAKAVAGQLVPSETTPNPAAVIADPARTVTVIKGNPEVLAQFPKEAEKFYQAIAAYVRSLGYDVVFDAGEDYTTPTNTALWIGHSRGADRLRFADEQTKTVALGSPVAGAINAPGDEPQRGKAATPEHFDFTPAMKVAIAEALGIDLDRPTKAGPGQILTEEEVLARADQARGITRVRPQPLPAPQPTPPLAERLRAQAMAAIEAHPTLTQAQRDRARQIYERQLSLTFGGKTLGEHLALAETQPKPEQAALEHLAGLVPDPSMLTSSVTAHDQLYVKEMMNRDTAAVMTAFAAQGLFITKLEETTVATQLNRIRQVKLTMTDLDGKTYTIPFKFPVVSPEGTLLINGIESRMTKQQVNLPICKISETRVNLASNFNKTLVERTTTKAHSFDSWIAKYIGQLRSKGKLQANYGKSDAPRPLPSDYTAVGKTYNRLVVGEWTLVFDYQHRFSDQSQSRARKKMHAQEHDAQHGILFGFGPAGSLLYIDMDNVVRQVSAEGVVAQETTLVDFLGSVTETPPDMGMVSEWTELKLLDKSFPLAFVLGYRFGLSELLRHLGVGYTFYDKATTTRVSRRATDLVIPFADGKLVVNRYPLEKSLIVAGLLRFDTRNYAMGDFDNADTYFTMLADHGLQTNYLKGIADFFDFFIDPITADVLRQMNEPTNARDLLIRATQMLTHNYAIPASSMRNHRLRGYERFPAILYNSTARALKTYRSQRGHKRGMSLNPQDVFLKIMQDPTITVVETINPIHDIKGTVGVTYTGAGGRTARSFVVRDRKFPEDGVGVLSECTPDSGKVAISTYTTADPVIGNIRGMFDIDSVDPKTLPPAKMLSPTTLLMPGATQDDPKRANFISIQMSHHVGCENSQLSRIRTGYELVVAHRATESFAATAQRDGVVDLVDAKTKVVRIRYDAEPVTTTGAIQVNLSPSAWHGHITANEAIPLVMPGSLAKGYQVGQTLKADGKYPVKVAERLTYTSVEQLPGRDSISRSELARWAQKLADGSETELVYLRLEPVGLQESVYDVYRFGDRFTSVSGSHLRQRLVLNVQPGERVKKGDVICYNSGFFAPVYGTKQVAWKHGVLATTALMERSITLEDSCEISAELGQKLAMSPAHVRPIAITNNTVIHKLVAVGDEVQTTDHLCTIEDGDINEYSMSDDPQMIDFLDSLNRKAIKAKYSGRIAEIRVLHSCDVSTMHPSVAGLVKKLNDEQRRLAEHAKSAERADKFPYPEKVPVGTKYMGVEFADDTVLVLITVAEDIGCGQGDKVCFQSANKSVVGATMAKQAFTASGEKIDAIFSGSSINARIVTSPFTNGAGNRVLKGMQKRFIDIYRGKAA